jgi:hypothetical protein
MKPDRFTDERAHHPRKATVQGRLYNIQKTIWRKKIQKNNAKRVEEEWSLGDCGCVCSIYDLRPAPSGLPPLQPEYLLLQVYTCSLLIIFSSFRLTKLLCYSEASVVSFHVSPRVSPFFGSSILLLIFFLPSPFFRYMILFSSNFNFSYPDVYLMWSCMYTLLNRIARRDKRTKEERGNAVVRISASIFFCTIPIKYEQLAIPQKNNEQIQQF